MTIMQGCRETEKGKQNTLPEKVCQCSRIKIRAANDCGATTGSNLDMARKSQSSFKSVRVPCHCLV